MTRLRFSTFLLTFGFLLVSMPVAQAQTFDSHQKISDDNGSENNEDDGFSGHLSNNDRFGQAIAELKNFNGDGIPDLAVGAPLDDDKGSDAGAVYILRMTRFGEVKAVEKLSTDVDLQAGDRFGYSITLVGDLDGDGTKDIAVGAPGFGSDVGAVWILFLNGDGSVRESVRIDEDDLDGNLDNGDGFGWSLAGLGDFNGDGFYELAVGAPYDTGNNIGAVYILSLNTYQVSVTPSDPTSFTTKVDVEGIQKITENSGGFTDDLSNGDNFGTSLSRIPRLEGSGATRVLAVGNPNDNNGGTNRGAVYILFIDSDAEVTDFQKISDTQGGFTGDLDGGDRFGTSVAVLGKYNEDNSTTEIAVGAPYDDTGGNDRGAVWVLSLNDDGMVVSHKKVSNSTEDVSLSGNDRFGFAVARWGFVDHQAYFVVGAPRDDDGGGSESNRGAIWIIHHIPPNTSSLRDPLSGSASVLLQGPYDPEADSMRINLSSVLPISDPYGLGAEVASDDFFTATSDGRRIVDWVHLQLLAGDPNDAEPITVVDERAALLRSDGQIVGVSGRGPVTFDAPAGLYHLSVGHRSGLDVLSATALVCLTGSCSYDFTTGAAFGEGALALLESTTPAHMGLWTGDADRDGAVTTSDFVHWVEEQETSAEEAGYFASDFDLDGRVTASDFALWRAAFGRVSHLPTTTTSNTTSH